MRTARVTAALAILLLASPARCGTGNAAPSTQASLMFWADTMHGTLGGRLGPVSADAQIGETHDSSGGISLTVKRMRSLVLDLSASEVHTDARVDSRADFSFHGVHFGTVVGGHLHYTMPIIEGGLRYLVLNDERGSLGVIGSIKVIRPDATLTSGSHTATFNQTIPIPMAGLSGQVTIASWLTGFGTFKLLRFGVGPVKCDVDDWEAGLAAEFPREGTVKGWRAALGYRRLTIDLGAGLGQDSEVRLNTDRRGPFAEVAGRF